METLAIVVIQRQQYFYSVLALAEPTLLFKIDWYVNLRNQLPDM